MVDKDELLVKLGREALAGPLGYYEREQVQESIKAAEARIAARNLRCPTCGGLNPGDITHTRC